MTNETKAILFLLGQERKKHSKGSLVAIKVDKLALELSDETPKSPKSPEEIAAFQKLAEEKAAADAKALADAAAEAELQAEEAAKLDAAYNA